METLRVYNEKIDNHQPTLESRKILVYADRVDMDRVWNKISKKTRSGQLGIMAEFKNIDRDPFTTKVILVVVKNKTDLDRVCRVLCGTIDNIRYHVVSVEEDKAKILKGL